MSAILNGDAVTAPIRVTAQVGDTWLNTSLGEEQFMEVLIEGYGENTAMHGTGCPVVIDYNYGEPRVLVFADINSEEPTHIIPLDGAKESARRPDSVKVRK